MNSVDEEITLKGEQLKSLLSEEVGDLTLGELLDDINKVKELEDRLFKLVESLDNIE